MSYRNSKSGFNWETFPFLPVSVFALVVMYCWRQITKVLSPDTYTEEIQKPVETLAAKKRAAKIIDSSGYFLSAAGVRQKYTLEQASTQAEQLAVLMGTTKKANWYSSIRVFSLSVSTEIQQIKAILNPNYVSAYRRTVIELYRDVYTDRRSLKEDVTNNMNSLLSSRWDNNLTKYFAL